MRDDAFTMQAVQLTDWQQPAVVRQVPRPRPGPGQVLLEVRAAGLCHSDLHLMHWPAGAVPYELPFTLGHEVAGTVAATRSRRRRRRRRGLRDRLRAVGMRALHALQRR